MSIAKKDLISYRGFDRVEDKNFILATWLRGLRYGNDWFEAIDKDAYFKTYNQILEALLANPRTAVIVACLKDDPEVILGYSVFCGTTLHWVFVKKNWRSIGLGKSLIPKDVSLVTHLTKVGASVLKKHPSVKFNPFIT